MEAIITAIVKQPASEVFELLTTFFIAQIDKLELASFVADCADEAQLLGLRENERLFRLAELTFGGGTLGTPEIAEQATNHVNLLMAAYGAQKSVNAHRAPPAPAPAEAVPEAAPLEEATALPVEAPAPEAPKESSPQIANNDGLTEAVPELVVHVGDEPQVRRRQTTKRGSKKTKQ